MPISAHGHMYINELGIDRTHGTNVYLPLSRMRTVKIV